MVLQRRGVDHAAPAGPRRRSAPRPHLQRAVDPRNLRADRPCCASRGAGVPSGRVPGARASGTWRSTVRRIPVMLMRGLLRLGELAEHRHDRALGELDLEGVVAQAARPRPARPPRRAERLLRRQPAAQRLLRSQARQGLWATPPSASRTSRTVPSVDLERGRDRDQREGVARPVAHLAVGRARARAAAAAARPP